MALLWVRVPQITGGSKTDKIYAYYGNPDAPAAADISGTYDAQQVLVLSFSGVDGLPLDATAYKNNPSASTAVLTPASLIAGGAKFAGKESITVPATASLRLAAEPGLHGLRVAAHRAAAAGGRVRAHRWQGKSIELDLDGAKLVARATLGGAPVTVTAAAISSMSQWHHVALTAAAASSRCTSTGWRRAARR
jgi:biopolymer transport protein ExbB